MPNQLINRGDQTPAVRTSPRLIAFYLPQYHPIPENDAWWGKGFTEWTNVVQAHPLFPGHYQPHIPADLGFYDLRLPEVRQAQADLATEYGVYGFCYYHYWFLGRQLLARPLQEVLASGQPDFPFCLCWANENWTRTWTGGERDILIAQEYSDKDDLRHIRWLCETLGDRRYIRVMGRPLVIIYRAQSLPNSLRTTTLWRQEARRLGIGELYLCKAETGDNDDDPMEGGFDAAVEFFPHKIERLAKRLNESCSVYAENHVFDYAEFARNVPKKRTLTYKIHPCVVPSWDNTARRRNGGAYILRGSTPDLYREWLHTEINGVSMCEPEEQLIFINAWNEWAEGAHLEPDLRYHRAYLEATRYALETPD